MSKFLVGVTGASGTIYASRLLYHFKRLNHSTSLVMTETAKQVAAYEGFSDLSNFADETLSINDFFSSVASGNGNFQGMAILPCSMGTLGKLASGIADNLLVRAADVCLKEKRSLVLVPREMPLHAIHLENMLKLSKIGACIIPATPHFYAFPKTIEDLVDSVVSKVLTHLGVPNDIVPVWGDSHVKKDS